MYVLYCLLVDKRHESIMSSVASAEASLRNLCQIFSKPPVLVTSTKDVVSEGAMVGVGPVCDVETSLVSPVSVEAVVETKTVLARVV